MRRLRAAAEVLGWRRVLLVLPLAVLLGCVSDEQEQRLGDAIARDINTQVPLLLEPDAVIFLNQLGSHLAEHSERPDVPYRFYIVNSSVVNAFALPGGHIYVTRGLIERTENGSELAAVLAHEIGHVAARHGAQALERELRTGSVVGMLYYLLFGREPALLEQRSLDVGSRLWSARHSRRAEREADRLALQYLVRSGVDPDGMITMLEGLVHEDEALPRGTVEWFSTHPTTEDRLRRLRRKVEALETAPTPELASDVASYATFVARVALQPPPPDFHFH